MMMVIVVMKRVTTIVRSTIGAFLLSQNTGTLPVHPQFELAGCAHRSHRLEFGPNLEVTGGKCEFRP